MAAPCTVPPHFQAAKLQPVIGVKLWVKYRDDESGHEYYWNEGAQESTYDRPEGFQTHQDPFKGVR